MPPPAERSDAAPADPAPLPPPVPEDGTCCGSGCDPCVWDWYQQERDRYLAELKDWQARQAARSDG